MKTYSKAGWLAFAAIFAATAAVAQTPASLPGGANSLQETFEAWTVSCLVQNGVKRCGMSQQQADQQTRQMVLAVELLPPAADGKVEGNLILPFGLALDRGATLQVDDAPAGAVLRFRTCVPAGCLIPLSLDGKLVAAIRKGVALKVNAVADNGKDALFSISLKGFPAGLDRAAVLAK